jgi:rod shape determining protein RodA
METEPVRARAQRRVFEREELTVLISGLALTLIGIALIFSAVTGSPFVSVANHHLRQLLWFGIGLFFMAGAVAIPWGAYDGLRVYVFWGLSLALLALVLVIGTSGLGAQRWLVIGGVRLQPSELAKLATIFALARFLSGRRRNLRSLRSLAWAGGMVAVPMLLILRQPDLGTSLVFPGILAGMLYWAGLPLPHLLLLVSPVVSMVAAVSPVAFGVFSAALVGVLYWGLSRYRMSWVIAVLLLVLNLAVGIAMPKIWNSLEPYQQQRITAFVNPSADRYGAGYQLIQSEIAIGSGGVLGQGYLRGTQKNFQFLPEKHTDFVFSVLGEECGLAGCLFVLALYTLLLVAGIEIARAARSRFAGLVAFGITVMLAFHVFINVSMTVGLAPVTGLPLPLLSYGGSSLVVTMSALGLLAGIGVRRHEY